MMLKKILRWAYAGIAIICLAAAAWVILQANLPTPRLASQMPTPQAAVGPAVGNAPPPFPGIAIRGPLIINFWASWCEPCLQEMWVLQQLYEEGIPVIGVNFGEPQATAAQLSLAYGLTYPNVVDPYGKYAAAYQVDGVPMTFFIGADGLIRHVQRGALTEGEFRTEAKKLR
jgi:thiol-disulfide isomerase/thioredoxin